jgi:hypothetical protein
MSKVIRNICRAALVAAVGFVSIADAADIVVVVVGADAPAPTKEQIVNVYLGRDPGFKPLDLPESNPLRQVFYKKVTGRDAAQVKTVWSRIVFTGQGKAPKEVADAAAVKKAVATDRKAIGYILKSEVDPTVQVVLSLD